VGEERGLSRQRDGAGGKFKIRQYGRCPASRTSRGGRLSRPHTHRNLPCDVFLPSFIVCRDLWCPMALPRLVLLAEAAPSLADLELATSTIACPLRPRSSQGEDARPAFTLISAAILKLTAVRFRINKMIAA